MKSAAALRELSEIRRPVFLAAGFFDGVHRGHQKVIRETVDRARSAGGEAWVMTFDTHPLRVLNPQAAPRLLTSTRHKQQLLQHLQVDGCLILPFTREFASVDPGRFIDDIKLCAPPLTEILAGGNWHFGRQGRGSVKMLAAHCRESGPRVSIIRPVMYRGETVSSTRTRFAIMRGNLEEAAGLLGRPFSILGNVIPGRTVGRRMGFPTANLDTENEVLPPYGVYAIMAWAGNELVPAVLNFGTRPTFADAGPAPCMETHLLDYEGDLYGHDLEVFFVKRLRDEQPFTCLDSLRDQIQQDVKHARRILTRKQPAITGWLTR